MMIVRGELQYSTSKGPLDVSFTLGTKIQ